MEHWKPTPGPWSVGTADWDDCGDARYVLTGIKDVCMADARLIESAPDLLEAAEEFSNLYGHLWDTTEGGGYLDPASVEKYDAAHAKLHAAICKATGRPLPVFEDEEPA